MQQDNDKQNARLNCGSCTHLHREKVFEARCEALGKIPASKACSKHKADAFTLLQDKEDRVQGVMDMAKILRVMNPRELEIFAAIMLKEKTTRKHGFTFFQKVFIRVSGSAGRNYLSNFVLGYIVDADKESVRIVSETGGTAIELPNEKDGTTLYTLERFNPIRREIFENQQFQDPELVFAAEKIQRSILNLDQADELGMFDTKQAKRKKIKKSKEKDDLVSFVSKLGRGVVRAQRNSDLQDETITIAW